MIQEKSIPEAILAAMSHEPASVIPAILESGVGLDGWEEQIHRDIAGILIKEFKAGFDDVVVIEKIRELSNSALPYFLQVQSMIDTSSGWEKWLEMFLMQYADRRCRRAIVSASAEKNINNAIKHIQSEFRESEEIKNYCKKNKESLEIENAMKSIEKVISGEEEEPSCYFPLESMNEKFRPPDRHEMITCAARTGVGKTALACQIAAHNMQRGLTGAYISVEMGFDEIAKRMAGQMAEVNMREIRAETFSRQDNLRRYMFEIKRTFEAGKFTPIRTTDLDIAEARLKKFKESGGRLDYIIVDYVQAMKSSASKKTDRRDVEIGRISNRLKEWTASDEFGCAVFAMAQLNREVAREGSEPQIHHLKECGRLEEDSDGVIMIHCPKENSYGQIQEDMPEKEYTIFQRKRRNGPKGLINCKFKSQWVKLI